MAVNTENGRGRRGNPWRMAIWGTAAFLLLLPLVAMQFTKEVVWTPLDFIVIGAFVARLQPQGMAYALVATAVAQALVAVIALVGGLGLEAVVLSAFFSALWLTSAGLFRKAARDPLKDEA